MGSSTLDGTTTGLSVAAEKGKPLAAPAPLRRKFTQAAASSSCFDFNLAQCNINALSPLQ